MKFEKNLKTKMNNDDTVDLINSLTKEPFFLEDSLVI